MTSQPEPTAKPAVSGGEPDTDGDGSSSVSESESDSAETIRIGHKQGVAQRLQASEATGPVTRRREFQAIRQLLARAERPAPGDVELRALVESLPVPALIARRSDGKLMVLNDLLEPMFGYRPRDLLYRPDSMLYADTSSYHALVESLAKEGNVHTYELRARRADSSLFWVAVSARSLAYLGHDVLLYVFFDISQRIEMEERLHFARQEIEMASLSKSSSLAHVAHELQAPLRSIVGYAELVAERAQELGDAELLGDVQRILDVCQLQGDVLDNALDLSKIETGKMAIANNVYSVDDVVQEAMRAAKPLCQRNANLLSVRGDQGLGQSCGDPHRVYQILVNLLGNAAKFTAEGEIAFEAARTYLPADEREWLVFSVRDNGVGMREAQVARLFKPFSKRAGEETSHEGIGFGLTLSRQLALRMGGDITAVSSPRRGSIFTVYLPIVDPEMPLERGS